MAVRPIFGFLSLFFVAGGILLQFFVILTGAVNTSPLNQIYFLQASTDGIIPQPRNPTRWTYFALCGVNSDGHNVNCGASVPALPFSPIDRTNFGTEQGVPGDFTHGNYYYLMSRFAWVFYLLALVFAVLALLTGLLALCSRLGGYLSGMITMVALFFQALAAALVTVWTVKARDAFKSDGLDANIGVMAIAFTWSTLACFFLATVLFCITGSVAKQSTSNGAFVRRSRSTRSRGSFVSDRRVKDDYS